MMKLFGDRLEAGIADKKALIKPKTEDSRLKGANTSESFNQGGG